MARMWQNNGKNMEEQYYKNIYVKLTNMCNLSCQHCYNAVCTDQGQMSAKTLEKILEYIVDLKEQGYDVDVALHGGEPMLYRDMDRIWDFVYTCNEMNVPITMTTNLQFRVTEEHIALFDRFKQSDGSSLVLTSWDYKIRFQRPGQQELWERAVKRIVKCGIKVQPIVTLTKLLIEDKTPKEIFDYMNSLGVPNLNFERLTCTGNAKENKDTLKPTNRQVDHWLAEAYELWKTSDKYKFEIPIFDGLEWAVEGKYIGCRARQCTRNVRTFNPDGSLATCPNIPLDTIGNINKIKTIEEVSGVIQNNNKYDKLCKTEEVKDNRCYTCDYYSICNGDCFQLKWDRSGCPGLKETIKMVLKYYEVM